MSHNFNFRGGNFVKEKLQFTLIAQRLTVKLSCLSFHGKKFFQVRSHRSRN